jgi:hypothetical protein
MPRDDWGKLRRRDIGRKEALRISREQNREARKAFWKAVKKKKQAKPQRLGIDAVNRLLQELAVQF